jgi:hypothetical protein
MPKLKLLRFDSEPDTSERIQPTGRTRQIERAYVEGYPRKLFIYRLPASPYWWVRFYIAGRVLRKSSKQSGKREALWFAQQFYQQVMSNYRLGLVAAAPDNFRASAKSVLSLE